MSDRATCNWDGATENAAPSKMREWKMKDFSHFPAHAYRPKP